MKRYSLLVMAIRIVIFLVFCTHLFFNPQPVAACSCEGLGSPVIEFKRDDAVFSGRVTHIADKRTIIIKLIDRMMRMAGFYPLGYYSERFKGYQVTFTVAKSWKLVETSTVKISTGYGGGDWGYSFILGKDYLVYAGHAYGKPNAYLVTSICSRNAELSLAADDLSYLNTLPTLTLKSAPNMLLGGVISVIFFALIAFLAGLIYAQRRRQNSIKDERD